MCCTVAWMADVARSKISEDCVLKCVCLAAGGPEPCAAVQPVPSTVLAALCASAAADPVGRLCCMGAHI